MPDGCVIKGDMQMNMKDEREKLGQVGRQVGPVGPSGIRNQRDNSILLSHGGYRELLSYRKSLIIYDGTVCFTRRFLSRGDRTIDQMVQAARSGKQIIVEGSMASAISKETEIKLTGVARASLEKLLED